MTALGGALGNLTGFHVWGNPGISGTQHIDPAATKVRRQGRPLFQISFKKIPPPPSSPPLLTCLPLGPA